MTDNMDRLNRVAEELGRQVTQIIVNSLTDGLREGMEAAAQVCDGVARLVETGGVDFVDRDTCIHLRDAIRLGSLSVTTPTLRKDDDA